MTDLMQRLPVIFSPTEDTRQGDPFFQLQAGLSERIADITCMHMEKRFALNNQGLL